MLLAACSPTPSPTPPATGSSTPAATASDSASLGTSATVVVRQEQLGGQGFYTEGAFAFVEIRSRDGAIAESAQTDRYHLELELLRVELPPGDYTLVTFVRPCEAACPAMDAPTDTCERPFRVRAPGPVVLTIRRAVGQACSIDLAEGMSGREALAPAADKDVQE